MVHHDSLWLNLDCKTRMNLRKSRTSMICKDSLWVSYGLSMVSVQCIYEFTMVHSGTTTNNKGKPWWHHGLPRCYYGLIQCLFDQASSAMGSYDCLWFNGANENDFFRDTV